MSNDLETRLLIPLFEHLKTDPVVVDYDIFSRSCAEIIFFLSFLLINVCVMRGFYLTFWHNNDVNAAFLDRLKNILKVELDEDDYEEDESTQLDQNGNELGTASLSVDATNVTDVHNGTGPFGDR